MLTTNPRPTTSFDPNYDYSGPHGMCGFNATKALFPVKTLTIEAGSEITFGLSRGEYQDESKDTGDVSLLCLFLNNQSLSRVENNL